MKRLLLLALTSCLISPIATEAFWKYGSKEQAENACNKWAYSTKTKTYKYWDWEYFNKNDWDARSFDARSGEYTNGKWVVREWSKRFCTIEEETRQFLGKEWSIKNNFIKGVPREDRLDFYKIKKSFRY